MTMDWIRSQTAFLPRCQDAAADAIDSVDAFSSVIKSNFEDFDKPLFVRAYAERFGFSLSQCVAVGDSRSDIPLFKEVGLSVALNATEQARAEADLSLSTNDLTLILPHIIVDAR